MTICRECRYYIKQYRSHRCGHRNVRRKAIEICPVTGSKTYAEKRSDYDIAGGYPEPPCEEINPYGNCDMYAPAGVLRRLWRKMGS